MTKEESANSFLKSFFEDNYSDKKLLFDNLKNIYILINFLYSNMEDIETQDIDWNEVSKTTLYEEEKIIDSFYKEIGINFKLNDIIKDGTFDILRTNSLENAHEFELISGSNSYKRGHKSINVYNNGLITDSIIWVHEISHYRNQPQHYRGEVNDLLTELLAFTEQFIYIDYLEKIGYDKKEVDMLRIREYKNLHYIIKVAFFTVRIYLLYFLIGEISKENYKYLYGEDNNYEKSLEVFNDEIKKNQDIIYILLWYSVATISIYNYEEYKEDPNYLNKIEELNTKINTDITLEEALNIMDIKLDGESLNKILNNINIFRKKLLKKSNYVKT